MHFNCSSSSRFTLILWNRSLSEKTALIQLWQKISADASAPLHCLHWLLGVSSTSFLRHQKPSTWILVHPACRVFTSLSDDDERSSSCLQTTAIAHPLLAADRLTVTTLTPQTRGLSQLTLSSTSHALWLTSCENILQPPPQNPALLLRSGKGLIRRAGKAHEEKVEQRNLLLVLMVDFCLDVLSR